MSNDHSKPDSCQVSLPPFITARYQDALTPIPRTADYTHTISCVRASFESLMSIDHTDIKLAVRLPGCDQDVQITEHVWAELMHSLNQIKVTVVRHQNLDQAPEQTVPTTGVEPHINIFVKLMKGDAITIAVVPSNTVSDVKAKIEKQLQKSYLCQRLSFGGTELQDERTLSYYKIHGESTLHQTSTVKARKPVIYLFPPVHTPGVHVSLSLTKSWEFSVLYPPTRIRFESSPSKPCGVGQSVEWTVDAQPGDTLLDHATRRQVSYLFWKHSKHASMLSTVALPPLPASSQSSSQIVVRFNPSRPNISPSHSVLVPLYEVTGYIDDVLTALGLHVEARCSFITYWLPDLQRHKHVALRFLPQAEYAAAAPMKVTPAPDVVTRVFMLFRGLAQDELSEWTEARMKANQAAEMWQDVVGVDAEKARDSNLFRVLEWGGMEVD